MAERGACHNGARLEPGALLFWRRSENGVALFAATTLVLLGTTFSDPH